MNGSEESVEIFENEQERKRYAEVELALHRGMSRVDAPAGFADRVMERASAVVQTPPRDDETVARMGHPGRGKLLTMPTRQWRVWAVGAVAAVIVVGVVQGDRIHEQHQRQAQAQSQFEMAQRITDQTLEHTRQQLERAGVLLDGAE